jgi:hypothetical protein
VKPVFDAPILLGRHPNGADHDGQSDGCMMYVNMHQPVLFDASTPVTFTMIGWLKSIDVPKGGLENIGFSGFDEYHLQNTHLKTGGASSFVTSSLTSICG